MARVYVRGDRLREFVAVWPFPEDTYYDADCSTFDEDGDGSNLVAETGELDSNGDPKKEPVEDDRFYWTEGTASDYVDDFDIGEALVEWMNEHHPGELAAWLAESGEMVEVAIRIPQRDVSTLETLATRNSWTITRGAP